jgi:hypothetical protein
VSVVVLPVDPGVIVVEPVDSGVVVPAVPAVPALPPAAGLSVAGGVSLDLLRLQPATTVVPSNNATTIRFLEIFTIASILPAPFNDEAITSQCHFQTGGEAAKSMTRDTGKSS